MMLKNKQQLLETVGDNLRQLTHAVDRAKVCTTTPCFESEMREAISAADEILKTVARAYGDEAVIHYRGK